MTLEQIPAPEEAGGEPNFVEELDGQGVDEPLYGFSQEGRAKAAALHDFLTRVLEEIDLPDENSRD